jgi:hypothetical protein
MKQFLRFSKLTAVAVLTLALGIGANTAIFSVIQKSPAASLPYHHPEQLAEIVNAYFPQVAKAARLRAISSIGGSKTPASRSWRIHEDSSRFRPVR